MEIRELNEKQIAECIENYRPEYEKNRKKGRRNMVLAAVGLLLIYLYLRLFNTAYVLNDDKYPDVRVVYSTEWVVNCPADYEVNGEKVTEVLIGGLEKCPYMRVLKVEEGIEEIHFWGYDTLVGEHPLRRVELPSTLARIGDVCFQNCTNLKTVKWEHAGENAYIGISAFLNTGLEEIRIPEGVTEIQNGAFRFNRNLKNVILPDTLSMMGGDIFMNCENMEEVTWSRGMTFMPDETFRGCENLSVLNNTDSLRSIQYTALLGTKITADQLPENVHCYYYGNQGAGLNVVDVPWLADYEYIYDAEEEKQFLQEEYGLPADTLELQPADGQFWLSGDYYHLDMTLEEFMATGGWEIEDILESKDKEEYPCYELVRAEDGAECYVDVDDGRIAGYSFYVSYCQVVLPHAVTNRGMSNVRIAELLEVEEASYYVYDWEYKSGQEVKTAEVSIRFDSEINGRCTIYVNKKD